MWRHPGVALASILVATAAQRATAQEWVVDWGATARAEYSDNYFFTATDKQSATTGTVTPFVTAARRTETSEVASVVAVGYNKVWGPDVDYGSGRAALNASLLAERSLWTGNASFVRSASLQNTASPTGTVFALAFTNATSVNGGYSYAVTENWSAGATAGGYANTYSAVQGSGTFSNDQGYYAGGTAAYTSSERTRFTLNAGYSYFKSTTDHADNVQLTIGAVHQFSPQLTLSASAGAFWNDTRTSQTDLVPASTVRNTGGLYGGSLSYALSEKAQLAIDVAENLSPSGVGTLTKNDTASVSLAYRFSERLTGRVAASYLRTSSVGAQVNSYTNKDIQGAAGISYNLAERWKLEGGYVYHHARYSQNSSEPSSNLVFVSLGYNWPGASFTPWVAARAEAQGLPGAGPVSLVGRSQLPLPTPALPEVPPEEASPFDRYMIP